MSNLTVFIISLLLAYGSSISYKAFAARHDLFGNNPVSNSETCYALAKFGNVANKFMAGNKRWDDEVFPKTSCAAWPALGHWQAVSNTYIFGLYATGAFIVSGSLYIFITSFLNLADAMNCLKRLVIHSAITSR
ncbi:MAG TPA: hypothetical protein VF318_00625 [Dehalococcoidales bacterium]